MSSEENILLDFLLMSFLTNVFLTPKLLKQNMEKVWDKLRDPKTSSILDRYKSFFCFFYSPTIVKVCATKFAWNNVLNYIRKAKTIFFVQ